MASSDQTLPVGFDGEFIITPLVLLELFDFKSSILGSKFFFDSVSTIIGLASESVTNSGKDTQ